MYFKSHRNSGVLAVHVVLNCDILYDFSLQALGKCDNKDHWFIYFLISKLNLY